MITRQEVGGGSDARGKQVVWRPQYVSLTVTVMPSTLSSAAATAHSFNKILNQRRSSSKQRSAQDVEESVKKLRRLILVDTIPSDIVRGLTANELTHFMNYSLPQRIKLSGRGYGKYCYASRTRPQKHTSNMSAVVLVKSERRSGTIHFGKLSTL